MFRRLAAPTLRMKWEKKRRSWKIKRIDKLRSKNNGECWTHLKRQSSERRNMKICTEAMFERRPVSTKLREQALGQFSCEEDRAPSPWNVLSGLAYHRRGKLLREAVQRLCIQFRCNEIVHCAAQFNWRKLATDRLVETRRKSSRKSATKHPMGISNGEPISSEKRC